ncbi:hypothetical protein B0H34DRAFT_170404 [Crassisporium funariophilum]|nr:hypothetical protein B0H34DRAFT_170404 [Crassisporium funariophilum]
MEQGRPNVLLFGSTGAGKSSVVNMLSGSGVAPTSSSSKGMTFSSTCYQKTISGDVYNIFDTAGLNEGMKGTVTPEEAVKHLFDLTRQFKDGVSLLVFVVRAPRISRLTQQNYDMFYNIICGKHVPIVLVINGLEGETNMENWWTDNEEVFGDYKMDFSNHACITSTPGDLNGEAPFQKAYDDSKTVVEQLISSCCLVQPWKPPQMDWVTTAVEQSYNIFANVLGTKPKFLAPQLNDALASYRAVLGEDVVRGQSRREKSSRHAATMTVGSAPPNIVFFGKAEADTSSVIGMLEATRPNIDTTRNTFSVNIRGRPFHAYQTVGLGDPSPTQTKTAIQALFALIHNLSNHINLLVLVVKAQPRPVTPLEEESYQLFHNIVCDKNVPIVLAVTGLEKEENPGNWWKHHRSYFDQLDMFFSGHAVITTMEDLKEVDQDSRNKLEQLILDQFTASPQKIHIKTSFVAKIEQILGLVGVKWFVYNEELYDLLKKYGVAEKEAIYLSSRLPKRLGR